MFKELLLAVNWIMLLLFVLAFAYANGNSYTLVSSLVLIVVFGINIRYITKETK